MRIPIGILEMLGALGLLAGFKIPLLMFISATGLGLLMIAALGIRIKIKDRFLQTLPALFLLCLNFYIAVEFYPV